MFDCCKDPGLFIYAYFCTPCVVGQVVQASNQGDCVGAACCLIGLGAIGCPCIAASQGASMIDKVRPCAHQPPSTIPPTITTLPQGFGSSVNTRALGANLRFMTGGFFRTLRLSTTNFDQSTLDASGQAMAPKVCTLIYRVYSLPSLLALFSRPCRCMASRSRRVAV